jgi:glutathione peroxidase
VRLHAAIRRPGSALPQVPGTWAGSARFPSNDFGGQEPGSNKDISTFCINEYAIDFPMFAKSPLGANPFYAGLVKATGAAPAWNFHKYLVDRTGRRVQSFATRVEPNDPKLVATLEQLLAQPPEDRR